jgi:hypothetical protein
LDAQIAPFLAGPAIHFLSPWQPTSNALPPREGEGKISLNFDYFALSGRKENAATNKQKSPKLCGSSDNAAVQLMYLGSLYKSQALQKIRISIKMHKNALVLIKNEGTAIASILVQG